MKKFVYCYLIFLFISCSKNSDSGLDCRCTISAGTQLIFFDWRMDGNPYTILDTLLVKNDTTLNATMYKAHTGDSYLLKLKKLNFNFKNGQVLDDLSIEFCEFNQQDSLERIYAQNFVICFENAEIQKISKDMHSLTIIGQDLDSAKLMSGRFPNAGCIFLDTKMLLQIKN